MSIFKNMKPVSIAMIVVIFVMSISFAPGLFAQNVDAQSCGSQYTVQKGDWLASIARKCGVSLRDILAANTQLANPNLIFPGQRINIPQTSQSSQGNQGIPVTGSSATPKPTQQSQGTTGSVIVQQGETLANLAKRLNMTPAELIRLNPNLVLGGQTVQIPLPPTATSQPTQNIPVTGGQTYTIQSGDTFESIANRFGITVTQLLQANPGLLQPGKVLTLPQGAKTATPIATQQATLKPTEKATQTATKQATQGVPMPGGTETREPTQTATGTQSVPVTGDTYTVQQGDTLESIAGKVGITVSELVAANPDLIKTGEVLTLPEGVVSPTQSATESMPTTSATATRQPTQIATGTEVVPVTGESYIVRQGDSLESIASRFDVSLLQLVEANPNLIQVGMVLNQPQGAKTATPGATPQSTESSSQEETTEQTQAVPVTGETYTVQSGDTLPSIASLFGVPLDDLLEANPNLIKADQILTLPQGATVPTQQATQTATRQPTEKETRQVTPTATIRPTEQENQQATSRPTEQETPQSTQQATSRATESTSSTSQP